MNDMQSEVVKNVEHNFCEQVKMWTIQSLKYFMVVVMVRKFTLRLLAYQHLGDVMMKQSAHQILQTIVYNYPLGTMHYYWPQRSWAKVIFLQACVCPQGGRGVCLSACWDTHTPWTRHPPGSRPPWSRHPPWSRPPRSRHPSGKQTAAYG